MLSVPHVILVYKTDITIFGEKYKIWNEQPIQNMFREQNNLSSVDIENEASRLLLGCTFR